MNRFYLNEPKSYLIYGTLLASASQKKIHEQERKLAYSKMVKRNDNIMKPFNPLIGNVSDSPLNAGGGGGKLTTPENKSKCFLIYTKPGVLFSYSNIEYVQTNSLRY